MADLELEREDQVTTNEELNRYQPEAAAPQPEDDEPVTNLFGEIEEPETSKPQKRSSKNTTVKKTVTKTPEKVGTDYMVYYAGYQIPVPRDEMTVEEVRQMLEADYPELSKERTEMLVDAEKKQIVPVVKGAKKG
ncbi:hypothetical protein [Alicyclobacillus shizuokensis]|uniref:hypothetical protein n=1 Tax=Alicyclobacillus shizuokensis TaxID=392014 RepID=UPI000831A58A|nr:hypothetical protein [Alicyclobacillus shizuokensis]